MAVRTPVVWLLRAAWLLLPLLVGPAVAEAIDGRRGAVRLVVQAGLWACWAGGLLATFVPATISLTTVRLLAPLGVLTAVLAAFAGASVATTVLASLGAGIVVVLAFSAETGQAFVQASAYGDERRYPLRLPAAVLAGPVPLAWLLTAGALVSGALLLAAHVWVLGALLAAGGVALAALAVPRLHRLTLRFLVLVPAGFVVHDPLLLAQTAMFPRRQVARLGLALVGTTATDVTGRAAGNALEVALQPPGQVVLAGTRRERQGRSVEVPSLLVAPSRPGRLLAEAAERGYPVGT